MEARHILAVDIVLEVVLEEGIGQEVGIDPEVGIGLEETVLEADIDLVVEMEGALDHNLAEVAAASYLEAAPVVLRNLA